MAIKGEGHPIDVPSSEFMNKMQLINRLRNRRSHVCFYSQKTRRPEDPHKWLRLIKTHITNAINMTANTAPSRTRLLKSGRQNRNGQNRNWNWNCNRNRKTRQRFKSMCIFRCSRCSAQRLRWSKVKWSEVEATAKLFDQIFNPINKENWKRTENMKIIEKSVNPHSGDIVTNELWGTDDIRANPCGTNESQLQQPD